jgi:hypothetical protein
MSSLRYKKMSYFGFLSLPDSQMTGHFSLTLKYDKSKIVTKAYWKDGAIVGSFKDYMAWDYLLSETYDSSNIHNFTEEIYNVNPIIQVGFYSKEEDLEGEFVDFYYEEV